MNISRYSHHFPCQSQHVLIRKYVSSKWPCSNRKSYNWINKSKQQTRLVPSVTPCTSKKHPLANCPCIFVRTTVIRSRFVISCGLHSPAARWVWTSSIRVSKWWRDSWIHLPTLARLDEWNNNRNICQPKSRIIILLQKDTVRAFSGLLYSYLSYIAFPQEQCHIASQSNVLEVALFYWTIIVIVGRQILGAYCPRNTGYLPWYSLILFQQILA